MRSCPGILQPAVVLDGRGPFGKLRAGNSSLHFLVRPYVIFFSAGFLRTIDVVRDEKQTS
jgi:hypothetical protein